MVLIWCIFYLLYFSIGQREISYQHVVLTQGRTRYMKLFELKVWNQAKKHCKESEPSAFSIGSMQNLRLSFAFLKEFQCSAMRGSSFWSHSLSWFPAVRRDGITNKNAESKLLKSIPCFGIYRVSQKKNVYIVWSSVPCKTNKNFDKMIFFSLPTADLDFDISFEKFGANVAEIFKFKKEKLLHSTSVEKRQKRYIKSFLKNDTRLAIIDVHSKSPGVTATGAHQFKRDGNLSWKSGILS